MYNWRNAGSVHLSSYGVYHIQTYFCLEKINVRKATVNIWQHFHFILHQNICFHPDVSVCVFREPERDFESSTLLRTHLWNDWFLKWTGRLYSKIMARLSHCQSDADLQVVYTVFHYHEESHNPLWCICLLESSRVLGLHQSRGTGDPSSLFQKWNCSLSGQWCS